MIFLSLLWGIVAIMLVIALLRIAFDAGRGYLADEKWIMPGKVYLNLGSIKLEGGNYSVMLRPANEGEARLYRMETAPPAVFTIEIEQTEHEAIRRYKPATCQNLNIKA